MSKVVKFYEFGSPEVLKVEEEPLRDPQAGEVRIKVQTLGLNRAEVMYRTNVYTEQAQFPSRIGYEAAGVIDAVGEGVTGLQVGDRVSTIPGFSLNQYGVAGEMAVVPALHVAKYPDQLSPAEGTSIWMQYLTVYGSLIEFGKLKKGDVVAITAASSSVGIAAIQMVNDAGGISIAITRTADKRDRLKVTGAQGVMLSVQEWGNPNGQPILFCHAYGMSHLAWLPQVTSDLAQEFRLVTFDHRGHGESDKPLTADSYNQRDLFADDIQAIITQLNLKNIVLVGHSMSGVLLGII
jgi:NADPH:quinone reductase-like Zn-dependent oxidoreductase